MTRLRIVVLLTFAFLLVSGTPFAMSRFAHQQSLDGAGEWTKLARDLGVTGVMAVAFAFAAWKITPRVLAILERLLGKIDVLIAANEETQRTNREVVIALREIHDRDDTERDKLLQRTIAALEAIEGRRRSDSRSE